MNRSKFRQWWFTSYRNSRVQAELFGVSLMKNESTRDGAIQLRSIPHILSDYHGECTNNGLCDVKIRFSTFLRFAWIILLNGVWLLMICLKKIQKSIISRTDNRVPYQFAAAALTFATLVTRTLVCGASKCRLPLLAINNYRKKYRQDLRPRLTLGA